MKSKLDEVSKKVSILLTGFILIRTYRDEKEAVLPAVTIFAFNDNSLADNLSHFSFALTLTFQANSRSNRFSVIADKKEEEDILQSTDQALQDFLNQVKFIGILKI